MRRTAALALAVTLAVIATGCATSSTVKVEPSPTTTADSIEVTERQVLVTLRPAPAPILAQATADLAVVYNLRTVFAWPMGSLGERCVVFEIPRHRTAVEIASRLATHPQVSMAQPIQTFTALAEPAADPYAHLQHAASAMNLTQAHRYATGAGVKIAVIDTGVDVGHPDLRGRVAKVSNFVDRGEQTFTTDIHGTAIAGAIAAAHNDVGIVGVAPGADLYALKACWPQAPGARQALCNSYTLARAVDFAILEGVQILNFSLTGPEDPLLARLVQTALGRGISVVAARAPTTAGNAGFPASAPGVLAVAESEHAGDLSAAEPGSLVSAPGVDILTTVPHDSYDFFSGSSLAAAQVSGVVALLLERQPRLAPAEVRALVAATVRQLTDDSGKKGSIVDACAAVARVVPGARCD